VKGAGGEPWQRPEPPAGAERIEERHRMVQEQIARPDDGRTPVTSPAVLDALRAVPRHVFVLEGQSARAYQDSPLPIGEGQTISQPYIVAAMTELLELEPESRVLEIGTGSGYQAAVLAHLTPHVYSIEILEPLVERARRVLEDQRYAGVQLRQADGYVGWAEAGPFDAIIVTCAAGHLPPPLWAQLKPGGRIVIPVGGRYEVQRLLLVSKTETGERRSRTVMAVRFVPMVGRIDGSD
jgi:protein-L-isoaspartate(D-aspartate) O-methyltransferase